MSKLYDGFKHPDQGAASWYLKIRDDLVYGPSPLSTLCDWAAQGRIAPGNLMSMDQEVWVAAETIPELKMDWLVSLKNGEQYGPFSLLAAPNLIQRGVIEPDAILRNRLTGKEVPVQSLFKRDHVSGRPETNPARAQPPSENPPDKVVAERSVKPPSLDGNENPSRSVDNKSPEPPVPPAPVPQRDAQSPVRTADPAVADSVQQRLQSKKAEYQKLRDESEARQRDLKARMIQQDQPAKAPLVDNLLLEKFEELKRKLAQDQDRFHQREAELGHVMERLSNDLAERDQRVSSVLRDLDERQDTILTLKDKITGLERMIETRQQMVAERVAEPLQREIEIQRQAMTEREADVKRLTAERDAMAGEVKAFAGKEERLLEQVRQAELQSATQATRLKDYEAEVSRLAREMEAVESGRSEERNRFEAEKAGLTQRLNEVEQGRVALEARLGEEGNDHQARQVALENEREELRKALEGREKEHQKAVSAWKKHEADLVAKLDASANAVKLQHQAVTEREANVKRLTAERDAMTGEVKAFAGKYETDKDVWTRNLKEVEQGRNALEMQLVGLQKQLDQQPCPDKQQDTALLAEISRLERELGLAQQRVSDMESVIRQGREMVEHSAESHALEVQVLRRKVADLTASLDLLHVDHDTHQDALRSAVQRERDQYETLRSQLLEERNALQQQTEVLQRQVQELTRSAAARDQEWLRRVSDQAACERAVSDEFTETSARQQKEIYRLQEELEAMARQAKTSADTMEKQPDARLESMEREFHSLEQKLVEIRTSNDTREVELKAQIESLEQDRQLSTDLLDRAQKALTLQHEESRRLQEVAAIRERGLVDRMEGFRKDIMYYATTLDALKQSQQQREQTIVELKAKVPPAETAIKPTIPGDAATGLVLPDKDVTWYLKGPEGEIFGPVHESVMQEWGMTGRVGPEHQVSHDQVEWQAASSLDFMEMEWWVPTHDGGWYGPLPVPVVLEMVKQGMLKLETPIRWLGREPSWTVHQLEQAMASGLFETMRDLRATVKALSWEVSMLARTRGMVPPQAVRKVLGQRVPAI